jgi:hypothetical protein
MTPDPTNKKKSILESDDDISSLDSFWDDIELTPVKSSSSPDSELREDSHSIPEKITLSHQLVAVCENITHTFKELDDSFMYLGVLKKLSLPESNRFFEEKFFFLLKLFEKVWDNEAYPEKDQVFSIAGEDYSTLNQLIHSGDATQPIYDGLKNVYSNVEQFRDSGLSLPESIHTLKTLFKNRKQDV